MNQKLSIVHELPEQFMDLEVADICQVFPTPTLIQLKGDKTPALFVSILLHGNEFSGLKTMQLILSKYQNRLPRSLNLFVGNVAAAEKGSRVLAGQPDFNRCWPGTDSADNETTRLLQEVMDCICREDIFAAIDLHNNSGISPHYACITNVSQDNQQLAAMFNHIGLVFERPKGVSTMAFDNICPALTLECGKPGDEAGILHAFELIDGLLHMDHIPQRPVPEQDLQLVKSVATVNIPRHLNFTFGSLGDMDLSFDPAFEYKNFSEFKTTDIFAHTRVAKPLLVTSDSGEDITDEVLRIEQGKVYLNQMMMPAMITMDKFIIHQDCLCYLLTDYVKNPPHMWWRT